MRGVGGRLLAATLLFSLVMNVPLATAQAPVAAPPTPPQDVHVTATEDGTQLSWGAPLSDGGSPILGYRVYQGEALLAEVTTTWYEVPSVGAAATTSQTYFVTAFNEAGESATGFDGQNCASVFPLFVHPDECVWVVVDIVLWVLGQVTP